MPNLPYGKIAGGAAGAAALYGANALMSGGNERWDRTVINTAGNVIGAVPGVMLGGLVGGVGSLAGAALGGYASDRIADVFDPTHGLVDAGDLLNAHLQAATVPVDPYEQEAIARAQLEAARQAQAQQVREQREMMAARYRQQ